MEDKYYFNDGNQFFKDMPREQIRPNELTVKIRHSCFHCKRRMRNICKEVKGKDTIYTISHYCGLCEDSEMVRFFQDPETEKAAGRVLEELNRKEYGNKN